MYVNPEVDLKAKAPTWNEMGVIAALVIIILAFIVWPKFVADKAPSVAEQIVVNVEDVDITRQIDRPPPPERPAVPVEAEDDDDVLEDLTIEDTDLDLFVEVAPPPPRPDEDEEAPVFVALEDQPKIVGGTKALYDAIRYPEMAKAAGIEGRVILAFIVEKDGRPTNIRVIKGVPNTGLDEAAVEALKAVKFNPAMQRDKPVRVNMTQQIVFKLK